MVSAHGINSDCDHGGFDQAIPEKLPLERLSLNPLLDVCQADVC